MTSIPDFGDVELGRPYGGQGDRDDGGGGDPQQRARGDDLAVARDQLGGPGAGGEGHGHRPRCGHRLALRAAGDTGRILSWLAVPGEDYAPAVAAGIDVTAYTVAEVAEPLSPDDIPDDALRCPAFWLLAFGFVVCA